MVYEIMITETKLADIRKRMPPKSIEEQFPMISISRPDMEEFHDTVERLWKVARAARRWTKALQGTPSIEAEAVMVEALDDLKDEPETP